MRACVFNSYHDPIGCVTGSVLEQFKLRYGELHDAFLGTEWADLLVPLGDALGRSLDNGDAYFMNALKRIADRRLDCDFCRRASRAYHDLVRYCCSGIVRDECFVELVSRFEEHGFEFRGNGVQGVAMDEAAFDYDGITAGVCLGGDCTLYRFISGGFDKKAVVYVGGRRYFIVDDLDIDTFIEAIRCCIMDFRDDGEVNGSVAECQSCGGNRDLAKRIVSLVVESMGGEG